MAYAFSVLPTPLVVRLPDGKERYACCATDALGMAPMIGEPLDICSRCYHCGSPPSFSVTPRGLGLHADGIMLWFGKRVQEQCARAFDSL